MRETTTYMFERCRGEVVKSSLIVIVLLHDSLFSLREKLTSGFFCLAGLRHVFQIYRVITYIRRNWGTFCNESEEQEKKNVIRREELHNRIRCVDKTCLNGISDQHCCRRSTYFQGFCSASSEFLSSNLII